MAIDAPPARDEFVAERPEPEDSKPQELNADGTPKRRRGRPPGSKNKNSYGSGSTTGPRGRSLENQIGGLLITVNMPLQLIPAVQKNALDTVEISALAKAIDQECQRNAKFRKYVESALKVQGATSLFSVIGLIAARRVVRNDLIDIPTEMGGNAGVDATLGGLISVISGQGAINPNLVAMAQEGQSS